jgi:hypothetical protein
MTCSPAIAEESLSRLGLSQVKGPGQVAMAAEVAAAAGSGVDPL